MALMTLKTIVFQNEKKKKKFQLRNFVPFNCLFVTWSRVLKVNDEIIFVKGSYDFTGFETGFSQKKVN